MNEEIDIIELLKRAKEGKAPRRIEIYGTKYEFQENYTGIVCTYQTEDYDNWLEEEVINLDTKIKILDKPIIEKLEETIHGISLGDTNRTLLYVIKKINEIIEKINGEEK